MMNILLIAATEAEIALSIKHIAANWEQLQNKVYAKGDNRITIIPTGVGTLATTYSLTKVLANSDYDLVIQAGIAGAFNKSVPLGTVLFVQEEQIGDLGAEDKGSYLDIFDLGLINHNDEPFREGKLSNPNTPSNLGITLKTCTAVTNNMVSGSLNTIDRLVKKYNADIESMEGAALHYTCLQEGVKFMQIRAVSNYVEPRNRTSWKLFEAVSFLNQWLIHYIDAL